MGSRSLRVGVLAPPWLPVPPSSYGGTELVVDVLCRGLQARGHEVRLFTTGDSTCDVPREWLFETGDPDRMGSAVIALRHTAAGYDALATCDVVHDHTLVGLFVSRLHPELTVVTTNHGPFDQDLCDLYGRTASTVPLVAISHDQARHAPGNVPIGAVIHHGLDLDRYPFEGQGDDRLVFIGRMNQDKGVHTAIEVARRTGLDLAIAAKMREPVERRYFDTVIRPQLGRGIEYVGEIDHAAKISLLRGARALINPIQWPEPFGLVMAESLACGTPVVASHRGAAPEIVDDGATGFLADTPESLAAAAEDVVYIDRRRCRDRIERHFSMDHMAREHEAFYCSVIQRDAMLRRRPDSRLRPAV